jgi:hypothetical protein
VILATPSAKSLITLLAWVGGVVSTIVGSWISSKIHVYHESRRSHLEDIKEKALIPLSEALRRVYGPLVCHESVAVSEKWAPQQLKDGAPVTERHDHMPLLEPVVPEVVSASDQALYVDAKKKHFPDLISQVEQFDAAWRAHASECYKWVLGLSEEILKGSGMQPQPVSYGTPYVRHYSLGLFVYRRLFHGGRYSVFKRSSHPPTSWTVEGFDGMSAGGTEQQVDAVVALLNQLVEREKGKAEGLKESARTLERQLSELCRELDYAIASRRLRRHCDLVRFF